MCGRFVRSSSLKDIADYFGVKQPLYEFPPSYNVAPTQDVIIINKLGIKQLVKCHWGFVPTWSKDFSIGSKMINARSETVAEKPSFKTAFRNQRCLVIANGFYEWQKDKNRKVPVYIRLKSGKPFGFAGLYNVWISPEGEAICTCTILTTESNELVSTIHDRMPVVIPRDREDLWLEPKVNDVERLRGLLMPFPSEEMELIRVSDRVNSPKFNSPDNIKAV
ncbi:MAG: SOS response-associated peptidase [Dissulfurispiraceae bacterium]